ncbi:MAG: N-6 DNA methylase [Bacteroidetes bacterium]|nr:N-6 DNA methylase [Bacteroidota bacterium]
MPYTLKELIHNFSNNLPTYKNSSNKYNEDATRREYIDPLLNILGWDVANRKGIPHHLREIITENYESKTERPDYTCTVSGVKKFFIEAKKPSVNLQNNKKAALQARRYGFSAKHYITVLTNFEYLLIFDTTILPQEEDHPHVALIKEYHFTEYEEKWEEISSIISRDAVFSGNYDDIFKDLTNNRDVKTVDQFFLEQINSWRIKLSTYLLQDSLEEGQPLPLAYINDVTQSFINQMIFLRICEDRNLPLYHKLNETIKNSEEIKEVVLKVLESADEKYNSGLFENKNIVMDIDNQIILEMIEDLYYPKSPYIFNVIESNLLGEIYEAFLAEKIVLEEGKLKLVRVRQSKKEVGTRVENRDIISTPEEIVKFIVNKSLNPLVNNKTPKEVLELKIADIASGSGVFLLGAFEYLINYVKEWYLKNDPSYLIEGEGTSYLPFSIKREILTSCIYGIDIDANAVEVAKFSLLLKLLEDETTPSLTVGNKLLPTLEFNILQGNSLIDNNHLSGESLGIEEKMTISPFDWESNLPTFDAIIGNPPYVKTDDIKAFTSEIEFQVYKRQYETSYKQFDKYYLFLERALAKLNDNGIVGMIVPNKFSKIDSGKKLRELLTTYNVAEFIDFGSTQLFKEKKVIIYSSIIFIVKQPKVENFIFEEVNNLKHWWNGQHEETTFLKRMLLNTELLTTSPWILVSSQKEWELIDLLKKDSILLGDRNYFLASNGVQTSAESPPVYSFKNSEVVAEDSTFYHVERNNKVYPIEKNITKPFFKPRRSATNNIQSYDSVIPDAQIIFPYDYEGQIISPEEMKNTYTKTWEYLNDYYTKLLPRQFSPSRTGRDVPHATRETWYHYGRNQALKLFNGNPKVIIGITTHRNNPLNLLDRNDMVIASGGTAGYCAISTTEESGYDLEYLHAVLNHPAIVWLCSIMGSDFEGEFYSRGTYVLNNLPIKRIDFNDTIQAASYNNIVKKTKEISEINQILKQGNIEKRKLQALIREKNILIKAIQDLVTDIYDINHLREIFEN